MSQLKIINKQKQNSF